jgi:hypothetical protein
MVFWPAPDGAECSERWRLAEVWVQAEDHVRRGDDLGLAGECAEHALLEQALLGDAFAVGR